VVGLAALVDLGEAGRGGEAVGAVEGRQVAGDVRVVVGIDDADGHAAAVAGDQAVGGILEPDAVEAVGVADLGRREGQQST
jgi:hypothetical protein